MNGQRIGELPTAALAGGRRQVARSRKCDTELRPRCERPYLSNDAQPRRSVAEEPHRSLAANPAWSWSGVAM